MGALVITGGKPLRGEIKVQGSKNSALPLLAAAILANGTTTFLNCPILRDVDNAGKILTCLGCRVRQEENTVTVDASGLSGYKIPDALMREMRSSVIFLGAILARARKAELYMPGGCELGPRPIDLHLAAFRHMGVELDETGGRIRCEAANMHAADIHLSFPSVGATENIMLAACGCVGTTRITNAAREPEIVDLQTYLQTLGYQVSGAGSSVITVAGCHTAPARHVTHCVISDRIAAGTYLCAAALTGGQIVLRDTDPEQYLPLCAKLEEMGCVLAYGDDRLKLESPCRLLPITAVKTMPYPGFPTDLQSPLMATTCFANGASIFTENIFDSRYRHVPELIRMGASIDVIGRVAVVHGGSKLHCADVHATDLRGGAALVIASLGAEGTSTIHGTEHIDRGYENIESVLSDLGGTIRRI